MSFFNVPNYIICSFFLVHENDKVAVCGYTEIPIEVSNDDANESDLENKIMIFVHHTTPFIFATYFIQPDYFHLIFSANRTLSPLSAQIMLAKLKRKLTARNGKNYIVLGAPYHESFECCCSSLHSKDLVVLCI